MGAVSHGGRGRAGVALALIPSIAVRMDAVIADGYGSADWTVIAKDFLPQKK
jgi:hypothetical protein